MPSAVCFTGMFFFCIFKKVHIRYNLDNIDESVKKQWNKKDSFAKTYFLNFSVIILLALFLVFLYDFRVCGLTAIL